ncbi:MAG: radical SAM protein, partial [Thermoguttaceae bacterium]|nr:radical SAM protein [Thermoguttaceae bacterium]
MVSDSPKDFVCDSSEFSPTVEGLKEWLCCRDSSRLEHLWSKADRVRREKVGDSVHFRGLVELSSYCRRNCLYCGIRASHQLTRYRMSREEVLDAAQTASMFGYGTVVIQTGEDPGVTRDFITDVIKEIKDRFGLAITLSLGERTEDEWIAWKEAGADRYLLRFETSNPRLFRMIHPGMGGTARTGEELPRIAMLQTLRSIGYEIGSGVMVGIPGQSID